MMMTFTADLTNRLAPFGWAAVGFVVAGLGAIVTALIVARASRPTAPIRATTSAPPETSAIPEAAPARARATDGQIAGSGTDGGGLLSAFGKVAKVTIGKTADEGEDIPSAR